MIDFNAELKSPNTDRVIFALYTLMHEKSKSAYLDILTELSRSSNDKIRLATIMVLEKIKNKKLMPVFEKLLDDKSFKIKVIAAISLANYQIEKAIPVLESVINIDFKDHSLHKRSIEALGKYKNEKFLGIFEQLITHRRKLSRVKATDALLKVGTSKAKAIIKKAEVNEADEDIKMHMRNAIRKIDENNS